MGHSFGGGASSVEVCAVKMLRVLVVSGLALCGCERELGPEQQAVHDFMMAWSYSDAARMFALHEDSGPGGAWCGSAEFVRSLERARSLRSDERCAEARALTSGEAGEEVGEEAILFAHQLRLVCGEERAGCKEWARRVFETGFGECALRPASFVVQQVQSDGSRATAYVDVVGAAGGAAVKRRVEVARVEGAWRVVTPLEGLCGAEGGG